MVYIVLVILVCQLKLDRWKCYGLIVNWYYPAWNNISISQWNCDKNSQNADSLSHNCDNLVTIANTFFIFFGGNGFHITQIWTAMKTLQTNFLNFAKMHKTTLNFPGFYQLNWHPHVHLQIRGVKDQGVSADLSSVCPF